MQAASARTCSAAAGQAVIRLTRAVHSLLPKDSEVVGLLALMLLTDAAIAARTGARRRVRWRSGIERSGTGSSLRRVLR